MVFPEAFSSTSQFLRSDAYTFTVPNSSFEYTPLQSGYFSRLFCHSIGRRKCTQCAKMRFGVGTDVGESSWIVHARGLAGFGIGPAFALLEFHFVVVEQHVNGHGWQRETL